MDFTQANIMNGVYPEKKKTFKWSCSCFIMLMLDIEKRDDFFM